MVPKIGKDTREWSRIMDRHNNLHRYIKDVGKTVIIDSKDCNATDEIVDRLHQALALAERSFMEITGFVNSFLGKTYVSPFHEVPDKQAHAVRKSCNELAPRKDFSLDITNETQTEAISKMKHVIRDLEVKLDEANRERDIIKNINKNLDYEVKRLRSEMVETYQPQAKIKVQLEDEAFEWLTTRVQHHEIHIHNLQEHLHRLNGLLTSCRYCMNPLNVQDQSRLYEHAMLLQQLTEYKTNYYIQCAKIEKMVAKSENERSTYVYSHGDYQDLLHSASELVEKLTHQHISNKTESQYQTQVLPDYFGRNLLFEDIIEDDEMSSLTSFSDWEQ